MTSGLLRREINGEEPFCFQLLRINEGINKFKTVHNRVKFMKIVFFSVKLNLNLNSKLLKNN